MHVSGSVRDILREATLAAHGAIGSAPPMRRLFASDYTLAEYRTHLARLLGFFEPLERFAARVAPAYVAGQLQRTGALRKDLATMGWTTLDIAALPRCDRLPRLTPAGIRGCFYVLLGSLLGGRTIARRLSAALGPEAALQFYGQGTGESDERWTSFCADLERGDDVPAICATANATFEAYAAWLDHAPSTDEA